MAMVSRRRPRAALLVVGLLVLLVAIVAGIALAMRPTGTAVPLDAGIPNGRVLIARGLAGVPGRGQPTAPIAVDRVATDGAATYVRFHSTVPLGGPGDPFPQLYDDTGTVVNYGGGISYDDGVPWWVHLLSRAFPKLGSPGPTRGLVTLGPLPLTARAAVLRFGVGNGETVRVPLTLAALRRVRPYAGPLVRRGGLQLRVAAARDTSLVLGYAPFGYIRGADVTLTDARGHTVPLWTTAGSTGGDPDVAPLACRQVWAYPPQRRGTRLTLTIRSFLATPAPGVSNAVGAGPWHLPVIIP
jgi:hypothetical protein